MTLVFRPVVQHVDLCPGAFMWFLIPTYSAPHVIPISCASYLTLNHRFVLKICVYGVEYSNGNIWDKIPNEIRGNVSRYLTICFFFSLIIELYVCTYSPESVGPQAVSYCNSLGIHITTI